MDHRVIGYAETEADNADRLLINPNYNAETAYTASGAEPSGTAMGYIDSGASYTESHQVDSLPTAIGTMQGASGGALNRLLPPGSEADNATNAAERRLYKTQRIDRRSSWRMVGIRKEWKVGTWIDVVDPIAVDSNSKTYPHTVEDDEITPTVYKINAPLYSVTHDFMAQETILGGLTGEAS